MNIFVGSLPFQVEESELQAMFESYGEVASARIITDKFSGRSRGFGFVEMPDDEAAKKAIEGLNNSEVGGRTIIVNVSEERKRTERKPYGGGNRGGGGYGNRRGGSSQGRGGYRDGNRRDDY